MFMAVLFLIAKKWKQLKCLSTDEWINKMWYIHQWSMISIEREWSTDTRYNINETWKHYAKWKKPVTKDHVARTG